MQNSSHENHCLSGESATHPIEPRCGTLAALLLVAGASPPPRPALPAHHIAAHSGVSNYRF
ncbi:MAG: hypothetical protein HEQ39_00760 [Rhizobacter sp.]